MARVMSVLDFFSKWKCSDLAVFDCVYLLSASFVLLQPSILIFPSTRGGLAQEQGKSKIGAASFTLCTLACFPLLLLICSFTLCSFPLLLFAHSPVFLLLLCFCICLHTHMFSFCLVFVSLSFLQIVVRAHRAFCLFCKLS